MGGRSQSQSYFYNEKYYEKDVLFEFGGGVGAMNSLTDLGGKKGIGRRFLKDINWKNTELCRTIYIGANFGDVFGIRLEGTFGKVKGYDSVLARYKTDGQTKGRYYRNLNFRSNISEFALIGEFHPLMLRDFSTSTVPLLSPYIMAGIGTFKFNPQTYFQGAWVDLEPLRLEGQGFKEYKDREIYSTRAVSFPMGIGLKYELGSLFVARFEMLHRFTNTDYLDDVGSGVYVNPALFASYLSPPKATLAAQLYDRHKELNPDYIPDSDEKRGKANKDAYFTFCLKVGIVIGRPNR